MLLGELWQILLQWGIAYLFFYLFVLVGQTLLSVVSIEANTGKSSSYSALFSWFLTGLLLTITCYAIVVTQGVSVTVFYCRWATCFIGTFVAGRLPYK